MTLQTKERILGGVLLIAIAAIFLPMLFDGEGVRQGRLQAVIPPQPASQAIVHYQPLNTELPDTAPLAEPEPTPERRLATPPEPLQSEPPVEATAIEAEPAEPEQPVVPADKSKMTTEVPVLDQQGVPTGWTLQLASFKERSNAQSLQQKLIKRGYKAYLRDKGEMTKVFVGPDLQKSAIEGLKQELKRELKLEGLVLRFQP